MYKEIFISIMGARVNIDWNIISLVLVWTLIGSVVSSQFKGPQNWADLVVQGLVWGPCFWLYAIPYSCFYGVRKLFFWMWRLNNG